MVRQTAVSIRIFIWKKQISVLENVWKHSTLFFDFHYCFKLFGKIFQNNEFSLMC